MDKKPSLSQYFGESEPPPTAQFFDEIGTSPSDMIQSIYLGDTSEANESTVTSTIPQNKTIPAKLGSLPAEISFSNVLPTVSGSTTISASNLPDPSTFFDNIGPEPQLGIPKPSFGNPDILNQAVEGLANANQQVDKEADRRRDAWIPNEEAQKTLIKAQSSPKGSFFPEREVLTMPGLLLEEELSDSLQDASVKYLGIGAWTTRGALRADHVSRDETGLRELLRTGYFRAAVNLTGKLIDAAAQGLGRVNRPTKHTARTLQLWLTRFAVMARIKLYDVLLREAEAFGDFSKPDMFYQFYPEVHGDRPGSLVPFSLRLLVAEIPAYVGKPEEAVDRLYAILSVIHKMLSNLEAGKTEDGTGVITNAQDKDEAIRLWSGREVRVTHSIVNCAVAMKDYRLAIKLVSGLATQGAPAQERACYSALCRLCLLAGHVTAAKGYQSRAREISQQTSPTADVREYVDLGLIDVAQGKYQEAYNNFVKAADQEPTNIMVANNIAVCLLYMGKLKDAIAVLQKALDSDPERGLNESLLINLCTLYELESSNPKEKKLNLLRMLCKYKSDTLPNILECLKRPANRRPDSISRRAPKSVRNIAISVAARGAESGTWPRPARALRAVK